MAQRADRDPGDQIEVLVPVFVPEPNTFAAIEDQRRRLVVGREELIGLRKEIRRRARLLFCAGELHHFAHGSTVYSSQFTVKSQTTRASQDKLTGQSATG